MDSLQKVRPELQKWIEEKLHLMTSQELDALKKYVDKLLEEKCRGGVMRVKEGKYVRIIQYKLGEVLIAEIRDDQTYYASNQRGDGQGLVQYIWLTLGNFGNSDRVSSIAEAIKKIKTIEVKERGL